MPTVSQQHRKWCHHCHHSQNTTHLLLLADKPLLAVGDIHTAHSVALCTLGASVKHRGYLRQESASGRQGRTQRMTWQPGPAQVLVMPCLPSCHLRCQCSMDKTSLSALPPCAHWDPMPVTVCVLPSQPHKDQLLYPLSLCPQAPGHCLRQLSAGVRLSSLHSHHVPHPRPLTPQHMHIHT